MIPLIHGLSSHSMTSEIPVPGAAPGGIPQDGSPGRAPGFSPPVSSRAVPCRRSLALGLGSKLQNPGIDPWLNLDLWADQRAQPEARLGLGAPRD